MYAKLMTPRALFYVVYDVSNRESFDALPRWYSELEAYVSDSVVKIVVGNKVDKVTLLPSPPPIYYYLNKNTRNSLAKSKPTKAKPSQPACPLSS